MTVLKIPYTEVSRPPSEAFPNETKIDVPALRVHISYQDKITPFDFLSCIDSGADKCVFPAIYGRSISIPIEQGKKVVMSGVAGGGTTYFHNIRVFCKINQEVRHFDCYAGFMPEMDNFGMGLLGRTGFFNLFQSVSFNNVARYIELTW